MRILLTRPLEQSEQLAVLLREKGIEVEISPVLTLHKYQDNRPLRDFFQAVIITSANSLRFANSSLFTKNQLIMTVGNKTAKYAKSIGFNNIISADGNLEKLSELIIKKLSPQNGPLLYVRGQHVVGPLKKQLTNKGYDVSEYISYEARPAETVHEKVIKMLINGDIDFIPFYSPRSALIFKKLIKSQALEYAMKTITALAISENVANAIEELPWKATKISDRPTQSALFKLIAIDL